MKWNWNWNRKRNRNWNWSWLGFVLVGCRWVRLVRMTVDPDVVVPIMRNL